jgi:hypothetical protein
MYICTSQSLFSHSYVVNEWLNWHCDGWIDIGIRADELGTSLLIFSAWAFQAIIKKFGSSLSRAEPGLTPSLQDNNNWQKLDKCSAASLQETTIVTVKLLETFVCLFVCLLNVAGPGKLKIISSCRQASF